MRRPAMLALAFALGASPLFAVQHRALIISSQDYSLTDASDCDHFHTTNTTTFPAQTSAREERDVPLSDDVLRVRTTEEGGVWVSGWDKPYAHAIVCKYAVGLTDAQAERSLSVINVTARPGELAAEGPEVTADQVWWAHVIVRVPKHATVDVVSANGGIAIRNMAGRVTARATNGGISVASSSGDHKVSTENGGIRLDRVSGSVEAVTQNGPISLKLRRNSNGPPEINARTDDGGAIMCTLKLCGTAEWNGTRTQLRVRGGPSSGSIRLATSDGLIQIEQAR